MSHRKAMLGKLALGRKQIAAFADEETWRIMLEEIGGSRSAAAMSEGRLALVIDHLARRGAVFGKPGAAGRPSSGYGCGRRADFYEIPDGELAPLKRKILKLWKLLGWEMQKIDTRVKRQYGVETLRWRRDAAALHRIARDLSKRLDRKEKKEQAAAERGREAKALSR